MSEILTADHGKESGHFYRRDGSPAYTIIGKNGEERPTTLRDARKENLVPSVTEIIKMAAKPGLQNWIQDQIILACLTLPRIENEPEADYIARIKKDSKEQASKAAETGTLIHAWVQQGFEGAYDGIKKGFYEFAEQRREAGAGPTDFQYYESAHKTLDTECGPIYWITEKSFATNRYGGKCDLHSDQYLIDIKTTDKDLATLKTWDEHALQLAAYDRGISQNAHKCGILYIHVKTAESRLIWIESNELEKGWKMFLALLDYFYAKTNLEVK